MDELIAQFSLDRVGKSGARFSPEKAQWFNAQYMHERDNEELGKAFMPILEEHGVKTDLAKATKVAAMIKNRATFVNEFWDQGSFFFVAPSEYDEKTVAKFWKGENPARIAALREVIASAADFAAQPLHDSVAAWITANEYPMGQVMNSFRLAIVGASKGPDMFEICEFLGKEEVLGRLDKALAALPKA